MQYTKPQIVDLGSAVQVVQGVGHGKIACSPDALGGTQESNGCAYEADE